MRKIEVKLTAFDLLYWVNDETVSDDATEQTIARNTLIKLMDLDDHWCVDESVCVVCIRPESVFLQNRIHDLIRHPIAVTASEKKYAKLISSLASLGRDISMLYQALLSPASHTVIRATAFQSIIDDYGITSNNRRGIFSVLGGDCPMVLQSDQYGKTAFDGGLNLTLFSEHTNTNGTWEVENTLAAHALVDFTRESLASTAIGDMDLPTTVERLEAEVLALAGIRDGERETIQIERHKVINASRSHPVLGRLAIGGDVWRIASEGDGRSINEAMRAILDSAQEPALTTEEAIKLSSIVFSKRGAQQSLSS